MKKLILLLTALVLLASCGGNGPEADAQKMCDLITKAQEMKKAGKTDAFLKLLGEIKKKGEEMDGKYRGDSSAINIIKNKVNACTAEAVKE